MVEDKLYEKVGPFLARLSDLKTVWVAGGRAGVRPGLESFEDALAESTKDAAAASTHRDDPAFWLYTSGSTGRPKAAIHRQRDMVYCLELVNRAPTAIDSQ